MGTAIQADGRNGRTDTTCENSDHCRPWLWVGFVHKLISTKCYCCWHSYLVNYYSFNFYAKLAYFWYISILSGNPVLRQLLRPAILAENEEEYFLRTKANENLIIKTSKKQEFFDLIDTQTRQVWVSMGLCWSANAKYHKKGKFPYRQAAIFSSQLWFQKTTVKIIMQIVYSESNISQDLLEYQNKLEDLGVTVKLVPSLDTECVLKSQVVRMLAFKFDEVCRKVL